jgi:hypothetical protein
MALRLAQPADRETTKGSQTKPTKTAFAARCAGFRRFYLHAGDETNPTRDEMNPLRPQMKILSTSPDFYHSQKGDELAKVPIDRAPSGCGWYLTCSLMGLPTGFSISPSDVAVGVGLRRTAGPARRSDPCVSRDGKTLWWVALAVEVSRRESNYAF